jgi:hypothetical protein
MLSQAQRPETRDERRSRQRFPIEQEVGYKIFGSHKSVVQVGLGMSLNMSSTGVLFTTESTLPPGERVELAMSWPVLLNDMLPLKLVARGRLVRSAGTQAAMSIEKYEFKTRVLKRLVSSSRRTVR